MPQIITGILRRMDDLGRIAIPRELRLKLNLREGAAIEEVITPEGLLLRPYYSYDDLLRTINTGLDLLALDESKGEYETTDYELLIALLKQSKQIVLDNQKRLREQNQAANKKG